MVNSPVPRERPGLRLTYPVETGDGAESREIPLVVGVLGDFGELLDANRPPLGDRHFIRLSAEGVRRAAAVRGAESADHRLLKLAELADAHPAIRVQALDVTKDELAADFQSRIDQSVIWRRVYEERYGMFGGEPFAMMLADFSIASTAADMAMLNVFAKIGAQAACPFITTAAPQMLGVERWDDLPPPERLDWLFASRAYADWHALRDREEARFVAVTAFADAYDVALSLLGVYMKGGQWTDAESLAGDASQGAPGEECSAALARHGFLVGTIPLREACTVQRPRRYHQPERSADAQTAMRLTHVLTTSRFLHAATCLSRDSIGSFATMAEAESMLTRWLHDYVDDGSAAGDAGGAALRPLAEARLKLRDVLGAPGVMEVVLDLRLNVVGVASARCTRHAMPTINPITA